MLDNTCRIIRQKSVPLKKNQENFLITTKNNENEVRMIFEKPLRVKLLSNLHSFKNCKNTTGPVSLRFIRKNTKYDGFFRKIVGITEKKLANPLSPKEIERELMNKDERKLLDRLHKDQRKYQEEFDSKLVSTMLNCLRTPKKKRYFV